MKQTVCLNCGKTVDFLSLKNNPKSLAGDACVNMSLSSRLEAASHFGGTTTADKFRPNLTQGSRFAGVK